MSEFVRAMTVVASNTVRELLRNKLLYNLLFFAVLLIAGSLFVAQLTIGQWDRVILDLGLAAIELSGVLISVLIGVGLVAGEIDRRTVFPTLAKPIPRGGYLLGRYAGLLLMLGANVLLMLVALAIVLRIADYSVSATVVAAAFLVFVELALLAAAAMFFGSFTTPILATAFTLSLFLIGHLLADLRAFNARSHSGLAKGLAAAFYRLLPDLELFNLKSLAASELPVPHGFTAAAAGFGFAYVAVLLFLAIAVFERRDLK
jgi:ABC-type transport system involved in multi-copper enzyme maturation permease subunit